MLSKAWNDGKPSAKVAFNNIGKAYLAFARQEPAFFTAMFESGLSHADYPELREAGDRAFGVLREACEAIVSEIPSDKRPPAMMMALAACRDLPTVIVPGGDRDDTIQSSRGRGLPVSIESPPHNGSI